MANLEHTTTLTNFWCILLNFWCIMPTTVACQYDSTEFFRFSFYGTSKHEDFIVK